MFYSIIFFYITLGIYFLSAVLFALYLVNRSVETFATFKKWLALAAVSGIFSLLTRYSEAGHLALVTLFEITFFYAWVISLFYLVFVKKNMPPFIQATPLLITCAILVWNIFMDKAIYTLNPLLDSFWLGIHVPTAILGYSAFLLSFAVSLYYLYAQKKKMPLDRLAGFNSGLTIAGVTLLAVCIITGGIWAKSAWGRFWSWDPKETWALITLLIYASAVVARKVLKLNPKWQAALSIAGFMAMVFTFFGVGLFLNSHHAYN